MLQSLPNIIPQRGVQRLQQTFPPYPTTPHPPSNSELCVTYSVVLKRARHHIVCDCNSSVLTECGDHMLSPGNLYITSVGTQNCARFTYPLPTFQQMIFRMRHDLAWLMLINNNIFQKFFFHLKTLSKTTK